MPVLGTLGALYTLTGTGITNAFTASAAFNIGQAARVRFWVHTVVSAGSSLTTITIKLQQRYNFSGVTTGYVDLPSNLDDVQGAAQPKGSTFEIQHAFTVSANATFDNTFYLDKPAALTDLTLNVEANAAGQAGDSVTIYGIAGLTTSL